MKSKVGILSLGCPRNLVDSESILGRLNLKGYQVVDIAKADIGIVNTCAFVEDAKKESIEAILELIDLKKAGKLKKIIVYGCLPERYKGELTKELPEIDAFIGKVSLSCSTDVYPIAPKHYGYLKICEGCVNNCSFCVIPKIKGPLASCDQGSVIAKVKDFNRRKISELNIIGQDITGYGKDIYGAFRLPELLKKIVKNSKDIGWIRLLYLYPSRVTDELLDIIASEPKICKYLDLPVQHINDRVLKLMRRSTAKKDILELIAKIRKKIPDAAIRTSLIVGFPTEADKEFSELLDFIQEVKFERLGAFIYSREEGTSAYSFGNQVTHSIKVERFNQIMALQQRISEENNKKLLGKVLDVLVDEEESGRYLGRTQYDAPEVDGLVYISSRRKLRAGDFVKVKIKDTLEYDLVGELTR